MKAEQAERSRFALAMKGILTEDQFTHWDADFKTNGRAHAAHASLRPWTGWPAVEPRPDWRPDRRMDPNDQRRGSGRDRRETPMAREETGREIGFRGPGGRRGRLAPGLARRR